MILRSRKIQARPPREPITPRTHCNRDINLTPPSTNKRHRRVQLKTPKATPKSTEDPLTQSSKKSLPRHLYNLRNVYVEEDLETPHKEHSVRVHFQLVDSSPETIPIYNPVPLSPVPINWSDDCNLPDLINENTVLVPDHQYFNTISEDDDDADHFNLYDVICNAREAPRDLLVKKKDIPVKTRSVPESTLVLDLEALVQSSLIPLDDAEHTFLIPFQDSYYKVYLKLRPHVQKFLCTLSKLYEIVLYTAAKKEFGEQIVDILDPQKTLIRNTAVKYPLSQTILSNGHRLYRDHCICVSGSYVKDLNVLRRDLAKMVALERLSYTLPYHLTNRYPIEQWTGNNKDEELLSLIPTLEHLTCVDDVRSVIAHRFHLSELVGET